MFDFAKNWPAYILIVLMICFFMYIGYKNHKVANIKKEGGNSENKK